MILVVDSGSTKTDWIAIDKNGKIKFSTQTRGLNPQVLSSSIISERIVNNFDLYHNRDSIKKIFFYGAGCGVSSSVNRILKVLDHALESTKNMEAKVGRAKFLDTKGIGITDPGAFSTTLILKEFFKEFVNEKNN